MHKKGLFAPVEELAIEKANRVVLELAKLNSTYINHSSEIAKAGPGYDIQPEHQISRYVQIVVVLALTAKIKLIKMFSYLV